MDAVIEPDYCYLTTRGRVTGTPHEIEIWFTRDGDTLYLLAGGGEQSDWVRNLQHDPAVTVRIETTTFAAHARVLEPDTPEDARARALVHAKYVSADDDLVAWRERALPVALDLHPAASS
jgi:deazaflavin-dependent oxidoreductase (nitroreductase family)